MGDLAAEEVRLIESAAPPPSVFKYYGSARRSFFDNPTIRFTQKEHLNDPFEMSRRWKEFMSAETKALVAAYLRAESSRRFDSTDHLMNIARQGLVDRGIFASPEQLSQMASILGGAEGDHLLKQVRRELDSHINLLLRVLNDEANKHFEKYILDLGVFSVSEVSLSDQMWALYANSGTGFVVELNAYHPFFLNLEKKPLLKRVLYTDAWTSELFRNPYYLFLVKKEMWRFEREWRMIKSLGECDQQVSDGVFVCNLPVGAIESVIFGYRWSEDDIKSATARMRELNPKIGGKTTIVHSESGELRLLSRR